MNSPATISKPRFARWLIAAAALALPAWSQEAPSQPAAPPAAPLPALENLLDKETVAAFASLPVQEQGRVKPLDTFARARLLRFYGMQSAIHASRPDEKTGKFIPIDDPATGKPLVNAQGKPFAFSAVEWLLVTWFRPDIAKDLRVFVVDNSEAVTELGLPAKKKRDRYTFNEIAPGRGKLMEKMDEIRNVEVKQRTPVQRALSKLAMDFLDFEMALSHFDFARKPFGSQTASVPEAVLFAAERDRPAIEKVARNLEKHLDENWQKFLKENLPPDRKLEGQQLKQARSSWFLQEAQKTPWLAEYYLRTCLGAIMSGNEETAPRFFPPPAEKIEVWHNPGLLLKASAEGAPMNEADIGHLVKWGSLAAASHDAARLKSQIEALNQELQKLADARGESGHIGLETHYHQADYFYRSLLCFIFGLLLLALGWVKPDAGWGRWCKRLAAGLTVLGGLIGTVGIVIRCLIMERPPITNLYETIIFITTAAVLGCLLAEWLMRKGWALAVAVVAGTVGMFLSIRFMNMEGRDTMQQLEAVLITNFWLSTHVPSINLGYAAGMVAAFFSVFYVVLRLLGKTRHRGEAARDLTRMAYAFVIVGLFLSLVGTVLGGIWANYSWGRFWGWDPKENGALLIVLVNLIILHARLGGYIREAGFHACCVFQGMVVAFSWFATNQLGVGLHAYGAMDGAWKWLYMFWSTMTVLMLAALFLGWSDRGSQTKPEAGQVASDAEPAAG